MPKKATTARGGAQRTKAKAQKSFEVVRQNAGNQEFIDNEQVGATPVIDAPTPLVAAVPSSPTKSTQRIATRASVATQDVETENEVAMSEVPSEIAAVPTLLAKGNAETASRSIKSRRRSATQASIPIQDVGTEDEVVISEIPSEVAAVPTSLAKGNSASARLAARRGQKLQPRTPASLVTAEHYSYVRRDLVIIAVLASIMFIAIVVLYFTIGRG